MRLFVRPMLLAAALAVQGVAIAQKTFTGFDRNLYPGDARMAGLRPHFDFTGYWLTPPPGATRNTWGGKRKLLRDLGFGFLVLADGRLDSQILAARKKATMPEILGRQDAAVAVAAATREGFPEGTIIFLDQEEGGRLLPEQAAYFFGWTEAIAATKFRPGAYLSGQPVPDGSGKDGKPVTVTTAQDVRQQIATRHMHPVTLWVQQDACPPSNGCSLSPPALSLSGTSEAAVWQYAQSPRRAANTKACAATYAIDNNCYAGVTKDLILDLDAASSADPSHGR